MAIVLAMSGGCGRVAFDLRGDASVTNPDAAVDATLVGLWTPPTLVVLPVTGADDDPSLTSDLLELYFNRDGNEIFRTVRGAPTDAWGTPVSVAEINAGGGGNTVPEVSGDGLQLYWSSGRGGGSGGLDVHSATRPPGTVPWLSLANETALNSSANDYGGSYTSDHLHVVISSNVGGGDYDIYESVRATPDISWSPPTLQPNLATAGIEDEPFISLDGLTLYYTGPGDDLHVATRTSVTDPFAAGTPITELLSAGADRDPWVSADGRYIMFASDRSGQSRLYESTR